MCGIAGFWTYGGGQREALRATAESMAARLQHRGPDDHGVWVDEEMGIAFGFRRLAILDLTSAGAEPMHSASGRYVLVFNGEIYNHIRIREELARAGAAPDFRGHCDAETLLAAVEAWGLPFAVERFIGMFAFALWDRKEHTLSLVRDRAGVKPLYYASTPSGLLFASEPKALPGHPAFQPAIARDAVALYARFNYVPGPYSIFENVRKLPPGSILTVSHSGARSTLQTYWSARAVAERAATNRFRGSEDDALRELDALLADSIRLRLLSDVPLGVFLSGGVDSSLVAAIMQRESDSLVSTFTIGFEDPDADEAERATAIATHLETSHNELYVRASYALEAIPRMASIYDEPLADSSQIPTWLVSRLARPFVTVALSGDGGDELFGGYHRYFLGRRLAERVGLVPPAVRPLLARTLRRVPRGAWNVLSRRAPLRRLRGNIADRAGRFAAALEESDPVRLYLQDVLSRVPLVSGAALPPTTLSNRDSWPRLDDPTELLMFLDFDTYLADDILVKVDRASMSVGLEAREPLLDHRLIEFAWSLPIEMKLRDGKGKWILRELLRRFLPDDLIDRGKHGFGLPLAAWLRGPLREWAEDLLFDASLADFYDRAVVETLWTEHLGGADQQGPLWNVLMFQAWRREWRV